MLLADDVTFLDESPFDYEVQVDGGMTCVVLKSFKLPPGFTASETDLLVRLPSGYPNVGPDMWWFDPKVVRQDGQAIPATEHFEEYLGRRWQRWSRHLPVGQWRSGLDLLQQFVAIINSELAKASPVVEVAA